MIFTRSKASAISTNLATRRQADPQQPFQLSRLTGRRLLWLLALGLAVQFALPQLTTVSQVAASLRQADGSWTAACLLAAAATFLAGALGLMYASRVKLRLWPLVRLGLASSFVNKATPAGLGGLALQIRWLQRQGTRTTDAATSVALTRIAGFISTVLLVPPLLYHVRHTVYRPALLPRYQLLIYAGLAGLIMTSLVVFVPKLRRKAGAIADQVAANLIGFVVSGRYAGLLAASILLTAAYSACLYAALAAVGAHADPWAVMLAYIAGSGLGSAAPTPGGLGAAEAALVSGLVVLGTAPDAAVAGVLVFRGASFWLPAVPGFFAFRYLSSHDGF